MFIPALSICSPSVLHWISKLFIDSIHILFLLYLLLWFWDFTIKNLQDFIKIYRAVIKDIFLITLLFKGTYSVIGFYELMRYF